MESWAVVLVVVAVAGAVMAFVGMWVQERRNVATRLLSIQRKLDLVMEHLDIADAAPERSEVVRHLENGKMVEAVRAYRQETGAGLLDAKQAVDRIAQERGLTAR